MVQINNNMTIVFFTNFINHHQVHVADELYNMLGDNYTFVATSPIPESFIKNGYPDYSTRPYLLKAYENETNNNKAKELALTSDIAILGAAQIEYILPRIKQNKITFRNSERWFKKNNRMLFNPIRLYNIIKCHTIFRNKPLYMLCSSAYLPNDVTKVFAYPNKCYKWGYFPATPQLPIEELIKRKRSETVKILWVARFIDWKHPEMPVELAQKLKSKGYSFEINMIGNGEMHNIIHNMITDYRVQDCVHLLGQFPNSEIHDLMKAHHIFCFTSDRNEGWGAVLNEAMSNGCCPVAADMIGAVPYLIKHKENGLIFKSKDNKSLLSNIEYLINNPDICEQLSINAYNTIQEEWSPKVAAKRLLELCNALIKNEKYVQTSGPCSIADIYYPNTNI